MADKRVVKNGFLSIDGDDWSEFVTSVKVTEDGQAIDIKTFGSTAVQREGGLPSYEVAIEMVHPKDSSLAAAFWGQTGTKYPCVFRLSNAVMSAENPEFRWSGVYDGMDNGGSVGELATTTIKFTPDGAITYHTA